MRVERLRAWLAMATCASSMTNACGGDATSETNDAVAAAPLVAGRWHRHDPARPIDFWNAGATIRWNETARELVAQHSTPPPKAARVYALLSVAQYDALVRNRAHGDCGGSDHAVVAGASYEVLAALFPTDDVSLKARRNEHEAARVWAAVDSADSVKKGDALGREVADEVLAAAADDGSNAVWMGTVPDGPGLWIGTNPVLPLWGQVRTWLVGDVAAVRPPPPPAFGSAEFLAALSEVRQISDTRTAEQLAIAQFWADGAGTATPAGHWNAIAAELVGAAGFGELRAARIFAMLNMAEMDASICCWDAKYTYWLIRPFQADPAITTPVGKPNFPSYTSGHSTFSGAAAVVLADAFPDQGDELEAMAEQAAVSRLYGGIHYRFDNDTGLRVGRSIGELALDWGAAHALPDDD